MNDTKPHHTADSSSIGLKKSPPEDNFVNAPYPDSDDHGSDDGGNEPKAKRAKKNAPVKTREMRLEQNRKAARESRKRKKVLVEELQRSVIFFSRANGTLRSQNEEMEQMLLQAQAQLQVIEGAGQQQQQQQQPMGIPQVVNIASVVPGPWVSMMGHQAPFQHAAPAPPATAASQFGMANLAGMMNDPNSFNGMNFQAFQQPGQQVLQPQQEKQQAPSTNQGAAAGGEQQQQQPAQVPIDNNLLANWMNLQAAMGGAGALGGINPAIMTPFMNMNPAAGMGGMMPFAFPGFMNQGAGGTGVNNPLMNMGASPSMSGGSNM